ncbi:hypothetical protein HDU97_009977 [Phlyctochytrium planicorne]|nr:hypothetical protein HDU97_009977 [Phlyctochytrium planicorne]
MGATVILSRGLIPIIVVASIILGVASDSICNQNNDPFNVFGYQPFDIFNYDITNSGVADVASACDCASICSRISSCVFFTYDNSEKPFMCFTKNVPANGGLTFFKGSDGFLTIEGALNDDYNNQRLGLLSGSSEAACKAQCEGNSKCRYASLLAGQCRWYQGSTEPGQVGLALKFVKVAPMPSTPNPTSSPTLPSPTAPTSPNSPNSPSSPSSPQSPDSSNNNNNNTPGAPSGAVSSLPISSGTLTPDTISLAPSPSPNTVVFQTTILKVEGGPTVTSPAGSNSSEASTGLPMGLVAGLGAAGALVVIIAAAVLLIVYKRKPKKRDTELSTSISSSRTPPPQQHPVVPDFGVSLIVGAAHRASEDTLRPVPDDEKFPKLDISSIPAPTWAPEKDSSLSIPPDALEPLHTMPPRLRRDVTVTRNNAKALSAGQSEKVPMIGYFKDSHQPASDSLHQAPQQNLTNPEMLKWTADDVSRELTSAGVSTYSVDILRANNVDGYSLLVLNEDHLKGMGVEPRSARLLVLTAVNILRGDEPAVVQQDGPPQYN